MGNFYSTVQWEGSVTSSGDSANCNQLNTPVISPSLSVKVIKSLEAVFGLFILSFCRNTALRHGRFCGRGSAPSVRVKVSFSGNKNTTTLSFR